MIYFFRRGEQARSCETRLREDGPGYELVVTTEGTSHVESFSELSSLLAREHELLQAWRAQGWREAGPPPTRQNSNWPGP